MMLMQLFNEQLANLPAERERLLASLKQITNHDENWNKTKAAQALKMVNAEEFKLNISDYTSRISFKPMKHFFSFEECSIENSDVSALMNYVESLLTELNKLSNVIQFSLCGASEFSLKDSGRTFEIECSF